ncbi:hypothetical protein JMJ77_0009423, partial [Colletotrichum scovillei]
MIARLKAWLRTAVVLGPQLAQALGCRPTRVGVRRSGDGIVLEGGWGGLPSQEMSPGKLRRGAGRRAGEGKPVNWRERVGRVALVGWGGKGGGVVFSPAGGLVSGGVLEVGDGKR